MYKLDVIVGYDTDISDKLVGVKHNIINRGTLARHFLENLAEHLSDTLWLLLQVLFFLLSYCSLFLFKILKLLHIVEVCLELLIALQKVYQDLVVVVIIYFPVWMLRVEDGPLLGFSRLLPASVFLVNPLDFANCFHIHGVNVIVHEGINFILNIIKEPIINVSVHVPFILFKFFGGEALLYIISILIGDYDTGFDLSEVGSLFDPLLDLLIDVFLDLSFNFQFLKCLFLGLVLYIFLGHGGHFYGRHACSRITSR